jgi:hypothetical protein
MAMRVHSEFHDQKLGLSLAKVAGTRLTAVGGDWKRFISRFLIAACLTAGFCNSQSSEVPLHLGYAQLTLLRIYAAFIF